MQVSLTDIVPPALIPYIYIVQFLRTRTMVNLSATSVAVRRFIVEIAKWRYATIRNIPITPSIMCKFVTGWRYHMVCLHISIIADGNVCRALARSNTLTELHVWRQPTSRHFLNTSRDYRYEESMRTLFASKRLSVLYIETCEKPTQGESKSGCKYGSKDLILCVPLKGSVVKIVIIR